MARIFSFVRDERGSIAIAFGLAISTLVAGFGIALDYSRISSARSALQSALDAAILSAGKSALATGKSVDKEKMIAEFKANLPESLQAMAENVQITQTTEKITADVSGSLNNPFGIFYGNRTSPITATASVEFGAGTGRLEIAFVLDTTGSMAGAKITEMKKAVNQLLDTLVSDQKAGGDIAVGLVPFEVQVRVETSNAQQPWITLRSGQAKADENTNPQT